MNDKETWNDFRKFTKQMHHGSKKVNKEEEEEKKREEIENKEYFYINCVYNFL